MYSTPASTIAAIMASPLSSAGTSTQARLSLRSDPACLFMAFSPSPKFVIASEAKQSREVFLRYRDCFVALRAHRNDALRAIGNDALRLVATTADDVCPGKCGRLRSRLGRTAH